MRTGVITTKLGMSRILDEKGEHIPVTVLQMDQCQVISLRTKEKDGYTAVQLGSGQPKVKNLSKAQRGHFAKVKLEPKQKLVEFRVSEDALLKVGDTLNADHFVSGQRVDVTGISIGKGFAGAMKRHNFGGSRASRGASLSHRSLGSTGGCQDPGRVFKGKKMAGQMGASQVTKQSLIIVSIDSDRGIIMVKGAVPGHKGSTILLKDAVKRALPESIPFPAGLVGSKQDEKAEAKVEAPVESEPKAEQTKTEAAPAEEKPNSAETKAESEGGESQ